MFVILLVVVSSEAAVRMLVAFNIVDYPQPNLQKAIHKYSDNKDLIYDLKPFFEVTHHGIPIRTNRWGMRDKEYQLQKPEGTSRIVIIGDSVAFGLKVHHEHIYSELIEDRLNTELEGDFEVLNFAVDGYNSSQEEIILRERALRFEPDMIILAYCFNDDSYTDGLGDLARERAPWSIGSKLHSQFISLVLHRLEKFLFPFRKDQKQVIQLFSYLGDLQQEQKIPVLVLVVPYRFEDPSRYKKLDQHKFIESLSSVNHLLHFDLYNSWRQLDYSERKRLYLPKDWVHLSPAGMRAVSDALYPKIVELFQEG